MEGIMNRSLSSTVRGRRTHFTFGNTLFKHTFTRESIIHHNLANSVNSEQYTRALHSPTIKRDCHGTPYQPISPSTMVFHSFRGINLNSSSTCLALNKLSHMNYIPLNFYSPTMQPFLLPLQSFSSGVVSSFISPKRNWCSK